MSLPELADVARAYADTILEAVRREYPNHPRHVLSGPDDNPTPRQAHPAFYGCFDWHSAVEMHWALVRMLRTVPVAVPASAIRSVLSEHLTGEALQVEAEYLRAHPGWERPYGWGWALTLVAEVQAWAAETADPDAVRWAADLSSLGDVVSEAFVDWLARATYPDRSGAHANSAFALTRALPHARARAARGKGELLTAIADAAVRWFASDLDYPAAWEPSGTDFLSPALAEAELVAVLAQPAEEFPLWLDRFLPHLGDERPESLFVPVMVSDAADGQIAHLHGLNLHRAHGFGLLADRFGPDDPRAQVLRGSRDRHALASLAAITGSDWMVEHWLAAFAVLLLS
ncbi:MAG: DUF2891 domain-containing protein [Jatrophihabitans sp.]